MNVGALDLPSGHQDQRQTPERSGSGATPLLGIGSSADLADGDTIVIVETVLGTFRIQLFDEDTPGTVENFLDYVERDDYDGTFIHRSVPGFIIQGGGFSFNPATGQTSPVRAGPPIKNEFKIANTRGTIAMAKLSGNPDSATNQWFINLNDNRSNLDEQNGGFTVFGRVIDDGMTVVDAIAALPTATFREPFGQLPVINFTGSVSEDTLVQITSILVASDSDQDGIDDSIDNDDDNDGVSDSDDAFPLDPTESGDLDGDGVGDNADLDDDGDDSPDSEDAFPLDASESVDTDADGLGNNADRDDDNDGMPDRYEVFAGHDPLVDDADEVDNNNGMTHLEVYLALPKSNQYLQNTTASPNIARLHIVNTSENAQRFTGTLFDLSGNRLGSAYQSLGSEVPPKGRLVLDSTDFESIFGIEPWRGPAMVEVVGTEAFSLMSKLVSRSGLISNTNCVRENRVLNIERYDPDNVTYVRLINTTENAIGSIKGTLYDASGNVVGSADTELVSSLLPKQMLWINVFQFEQLFGEQWDGAALLEVTETEGLKLLNLNLINGETFFNFSCFEQSNESDTGRVYLQTSTTGPNISMTHIVNTSPTSQQFTATMYNKAGEQLGAANQVLGNAASRGRVVVSTADLEEIFGVSPWKGPSMLEVSGSASFELMTKQTSRSGLVSNVNCVRQNQVHNIEGMDSSAITYIRFINTSDTAINNVTGTLYDSNGAMVGPPGKTLLATIAPKEQVFINRNNLIDIFDGVTWNGEVMLEVESDEALRLLNLNFINSETFFNFSCYENSN